MTAIFPVILIKSRVAWQVNATAVTATDTLELDITANTPHIDTTTGKLYLVQIIGVTTDSINQNFYFFIRVR